MRNEKNTYILLTRALIKALNAKRKEKGLTTIEDSLIARKLGILFAFKSNNHVNFQAEHVEIDESQMTILQELLDQYFNVNMTNDIHQFAIIPEHQGVESHNGIALENKHKGFFKKIKSFLAK